MTIRGKDNPSSATNNGLGRSGPVSAGGVTPGCAVTPTVLPEPPVLVWPAAPVAPVPGALSEEAAPVEAGVVEVLAAG